MPKYKVPVTWEMTAFAVVKARNTEEALGYASDYFADDAEFRDKRPTQGSYRVHEEQMQLLAVICVCDDCEEEYTIEDDLQHMWPDIPDLGDRVSPGESVPLAECPKCQALCHVPEEKKAV